MLLPTMSHEEMVKHITEDAARAQSLINRCSKIMRKTMRKCINKKILCSNVNWTSPATKQKYIITFVTDNVSSSCKVRAVIFAIYNVRAGHLQLIATNVQGGLNIYTHHFMERYMAREHKFDELNIGDFCAHLTGRSEYFVDIYNHGDDYVLASPEGLMMTKQEGIAVVFKTYVSRDIMIGKQAKAFDNIRKYLIYALDEYRRLLTKKRDNELAVDTVHTYMGTISAEAEELYKQFFKPKES